MKPSIGRVVHYVDSAGIHCAGLIVHVWSDTCVNIAYFTHNGEARAATSVSLSEDGSALYSWHWPERE